MESLSIAGYIAIGILVFAICFYLYAERIADEDAGILFAIIAAAVFWPLTLFVSICAVSFVMFLCSFSKLAEIVVKFKYKE